VYIQLSITCTKAYNTIY